MADREPAVLAIDGGNSKTDVALVAFDGTLLASARGPGINAHDVGVDQLTFEGRVTTLLVRRDDEGVPARFEERAEAESA